MYNCLDEIQSAMYDYIMHKRLSPLLDEVICKTEGISVQERCGVYRNNVMTSLKICLYTTYPVVEKIIGTETFGQLAEDYITQHPPQSGILHEYGYEFPEFLLYNNHELLSSKPYLYDLAILETALHKASNISVSNSLSLDRLVSYDIQDDTIQIYFKLSECVSLIKSEYQINQIRNNIIEQNDDKVDNHHKTTYLMVTRVDGEPTIYNINKMEYYLLLNLRSGKSLDESYQKALNECGIEDYDLSVLLAEHFVRGSFITLSSNNKFK